MHRCFSILSFSEQIPSLQKNSRNILNTFSIYSFLGVSVGSTLKDLAQYRPDIFGVGSEETMIGKRLGEEEKRDEKLVWDGHTASMERATKLAQANITLDEQIEAIHKAKGLM